MNKEQKIKYLIEKGLNHGDRVYFQVENQISQQYFRTNKGILNLEDEEAPYIDCEDKYGKFKMTICNGYDAYLNTISKAEMRVKHLINMLEKCDPEAILIRKKIHNPLHCVFRETLIKVKEYTIKPEYSIGKEDDGRVLIELEDI